MSTAGGHPCEIRTPRLLLRPWRRNDLEGLMKLTQDPGCRAFWGLFQDALDQKKAAHWIDCATTAMSSSKLGSWAVFDREQMVGVLNLVHRRLDGDQEMLPTLEFRFKSVCYQNGQAVEAVQGLIAFGQKEHKIKSFFAFLPAQDVGGRALAAAVGLSPRKAASFERVQVEVFCNEPLPDAKAKAPSQPHSEASSASVV